MSGFEDKLALSQWMLTQFGADKLEMLGNMLSGDHLIGFYEEDSSKYIHELVTLISESNRVVKDDQLRAYDDNIVRHWKWITRKRNQGEGNIYPLYFQYMSLLFTEHYLYRYFTDRVALCDDLNSYLEQFNLRFKDGGIKPFKTDDLNKLAVWIATGGGKTLIMHVNILQFKQYMGTAGLNRIILLTPNEGLSLQHKKELDLSGVKADLFFKRSGGLLTGTAVEIIDIHKLKEKPGEKTIAVESFESDNLVLVDEGHRGAGGFDWMSKRNQLCENGFSFEYSATFGQAIKAVGGSDRAPSPGQVPSTKYRLSQQYARCILFDYSYKFFHSDGYGKDHYILNLSHVWTSEQTQLYLTGCIMMFYQQKLLYKDSGKAVAQYNLTDPLWIFVGGRVTAKNEANDKTVSDVQAILRFISRFVQNKDGESIRLIKLFLEQRDDLQDDSGRSIFAKAFSYLQKRWTTDEAAALFSDLLVTVFHAQAIGKLHVVHLKGSGEVGLRVSDNDWFGLINVGDATKLVKICEDTGDENMVVSDQIFSDSLFHGIDEKNSSINLLVGAKKFTEGWSSWRVSTMGLMNVGRSEGSEIIQLFGRGVRLKGHGFSLKRSNAIDNAKHPEHITLLETLNVFGIRSDYMKEFERYLEVEEAGKDSAELVVLPVIKRLERNDLRLIRLKKDTPTFGRTQRLSLLTPPEEMTGRITLNWYPKIRSRYSEGIETANVGNQLNEDCLEDRHLAFLDFDAIYFELVRYKKEKAWHNLQISRKAIYDLLADTSWYRLYIQREILEPYDFKRVIVWQEIAVALLKKYMRRYYTFRKNQYEGPNLEYYEIRETDDNFFDEYKATVNRNEQNWIAKLGEIRDNLADKNFSESCSFEKLNAFYFSQHLYQPMIHFSNNEVLKISPVPLNDGEHDFVESLRKFHVESSKSNFLKDKKLFLLRNQSRGRGVGFFEAGNFYPDFVLWIIQGETQYVCFIDPKGLVHVNGFDDPKVLFHKTVKSIQNRLGDPNVILDSFIVSNTPFSRISWWSKASVPKREFTENHILFQEDDEYVGDLFSMLLATSGVDGSGVQLA